MSDIYSNQLVPVLVSMEMFLVVCGSLLFSFLLARLKCTFMQSLMCSEEGSEL